MNEQVANATGWLRFNAGRASLQTGNPQRALTEFDAALESIDRRSQKTLACLMLDSSVESSYAFGGGPSIT
jgi:hypothetical protein